MPVASSQLTVTRTTTTSYTAPIVASPAVPAGGKLDVGLYVDSVNGTRPAGTTPRPVGCTQTNVFKRGEQFVLRAWGIGHGDGQRALDARTSTRPRSRFPASPPVTLNWGAHGATTNRVWFWSNAWNIPADYPARRRDVRVTFKIDSGKVGIYDYVDHDHPLEPSRERDHHHDHHHSLGHPQEGHHRRARSARRCSCCRRSRLAERRPPSRRRRSRASPLCPGPSSTPASLPRTMKLLKTTPDIALAGAAVTISGSGLPAGKDVTLDLGHGQRRLGARSTRRQRRLPRPQGDEVRRRSSRRRTTSASGAFSVQLKAPQDFGGLHEIYAVVDGVQVAKGGFLLARSASISPKRGPIGTHDHDHGTTGLGSSLYEGGGSLLYDNKYVGAVMANWTRGVAKVHIRASRPGRQAHDRDRRRDQLQVPEHRAVADPLGHGLHVRPSWSRRTTAVPQPRIDWPANVAPTRRDADDARRRPGLGAADKLDGQPERRRPAPVLTKVGFTAAGLTPNAAGRPPVGDRRRQPRQLHRGRAGASCRSRSARRPPPPAARSSSQIQVPDGLGGWHVIQVLQGGQVKAQVPYFVKRSFVGNGVSSLKLKRGQPFTIHLKGVGWTQLDNTIAVDLRQQLRRLRLRVQLERRRP